MLVEGVLTSEKIFKIPSQKVGKFLINKKSEVKSDLPTNIEKTMILSMQTMNNVVANLVEDSKQFKSNLLETLKNTTLATSPSQKRKANDIQEENIDIENNQIFTVNCFVKKIFQLFFVFSICFIKQIIRHLQMNCV